MKKYSFYPTFGVDDVYANITGVGMPVAVSTPVVINAKNTDNVISVTTIPSDADVYYTTNGSTPTEESTEWTDDVTIVADTTFKFLAVADGNFTDTTKTLQATFKQIVANPVGACESNTVTMTCATADATIYYTSSYKEGESVPDPDPSSPVTQEYEEGIEIANTTRFKMLAVKEGCFDSEIIEYTATYVEPV